MKERIIGAAVLVVLAVLVVPVFLDGPPQEGEIVSQRLLLPGQEEQKTQTVVLDRDRTEPVPAAATPEPEPARTQQDVAVEPPPSSAPAARDPEPESKSETGQAAGEPPPSSKPAPTAASTTGMWAVQLGSFSNKDNAEKLAADLRRQGYAAFLSQLQTANGVMHRVRIGPQKDRQSAEAMATRLSRVGHNGKVVPHP
ncbi:MAG: SPOR domain-containing protein [Gammaproteobacteria bacterium]|nr:SPOR domain-containing protein [Gammaproteobacteria bacterium]